MRLKNCKNLRTTNLDPKVTNFYKMKTLYIYIYIFFFFFFLSLGETIQHELKCATIGFMFITIIRHIKSLIQIESILFDSI